MREVIGLAVRRPVAVTACCLLVVALAVVAAVRLPVALLPSLKYPAFLIWTGYSDVAPERVERAITVRIEETVLGTPGVSRVTSRSQLGGSLVRLDFGWNTDLDLAALHVRQQLDRLSGTLPFEADRPVVLRIDPSGRPILVLALAATERNGPQDGKAWELVAAKEIARDVVSRRLEQVEGVARVRVTGGFDREISIVVSPEKLAAYGIELNDVATALAAANVSLAGGTVRQGAMRYAIEVSGELRRPEDVAATLVSERGRPPVALHQVATVREDLAARRGLVRLDGRESLLLLVERRPGANTVRTAAEVREALAALRKEVPGLELDVVVDESRFIEAALRGVYQAVAWGGLLAVVVLIVFLRRLHALAAVAVAVPLALAITLVCFDLLGVSINLISLSGLALGVGLLVDNAIVVVENISRLRDQGLEPRLAARDGTAGVALAITASTLTTVAVFLPLSFVEGLAGRLFRDQSLAVVCSLAASLVVALIVVPLIASREPVRHRGRAAGTFWIPGYERLLQRTLARPAAVLVAAGGFLAAMTYLAWQLPRETVPPAREGRVEVDLELPADAGLDLVASRAADVETAVRRFPEVRRTLADLGERDDALLELDPRPPYRGSLTLVLDRGEAVAPVLERLGRTSFAADLTVHARAVRGHLESLLLTHESDLVIDLSGEGRRAAEMASEELVRDLERSGELVNVRLADPEEIPAYRLGLDRRAMLRHGLRPEAVRTAIEAATRGREATRLDTVDDEIPVVIHNPRVDSLEKLLAVRISASEGLLPLGSFVDARPVRLPAVLARYDQVPAVRLLADVAPGHDLKAAIAAVRGAFASLPAGVRGRVGGSNEAFRSSLRAVASSIGLSVLLVYLILAAQFESLVQPLVILAAVPLAVGGVVLALAVTGQSWSLMSLTGCVVLVGIAVNDAIVKVDFINQERLAGRPLDEAIRLAGRHRARPVVMTTVTTALGLLPLALGLGEGAALRAPLAIAIVGGVLVATLLTLFVVPAIYIGMENLKQRMSPVALEGRSRSLASNVEGKVAVEL